MLTTERKLSVELRNEMLTRVTFNGSIITDATADKRQEMDQVPRTHRRQGHCAKRYGEDEKTHAVVKASIMQVAG